MRGSQADKFPRLFWWSLGLGVICLILGAGNLYLGTQRARHYRDTIQSLTAERDDSFKTPSIANRGRLVRKSSSSSSTTRVFTYGTEKEADVTDASGRMPSEQSVDDEYLMSAKRRYEYYQFCIIGGKCLLAISGCLFLLSLIIGRISISDES
jgi:hypothetical protein